MRFKKVTLSILLSLALMASFMPAAAFAQEAPETAEVEVKAQAGGGVTVSGLEPDELLMQYIDERVAEETASSGTMKAMAVKNLRREKLSDTEKKLYDALAPQIREVANGKRASTVFEVPVSAALKKDFYTKSELGVDAVIEDATDEDGNSYRRIIPKAYTAFQDAVTIQLNESVGNVLRALIFDMPYELYWLDNENAVDNYEWDTDDIKAYDGGEYQDQIYFEDPTADHVPSIAISFCVSRNYSIGSSEGNYGPAKTKTVNTALTKDAAKTASNISDIINRAKGDEPDVKKLVMYRDEICRLTSYHPTAMEDEDYPYGDPWQLIYVFDGDPDTKVVCEGYSKAFQYLCDNTVFADPELESRLVSGEIVRDGKKLGAHMWNIVHMDDGYNYIADITNCDSDDTDAGSAGDARELFLTSALSGSVKGGYVYSFEKTKLKYVYDSATRSLYSEPELTLAFEDYPHYKGDDGGIKGKNPIAASGKTVKLKAGTLKRKNQTIAAEKAVTVKKAAGDVSYKLVKVNKKSAKKKFSVSKSGKITVKKGLKKGSYKLTMAVKAAGDLNYSAGTKKVTVTINVR